jgi:hypothetical protein
MSNLNTTLIYHIPKGHANAITGNRLGKSCGLTKPGELRMMRREIRELTRRGELIGLSTRKPRGYYRIETPEELKDTCETLKNYCVEAALHRRDLIRAAKHLRGQFRLEV